MIETTLSKVGNSMAVLLPKSIRQDACISPQQPLRVESPRKGVVVISSLLDDEEDRLSRLQTANEQIRGRARTAKPWPAGKTAEDILDEGKDAAADELFSL